MKIIIPLAGKDPRFDIFNEAKPMIDISGKPLIDICISSIDLFEEPQEIIFIILKEHSIKYNLSNRLVALYEQKHCVKVIELESTTEGSACSVLMAKEYLNNEDPVIIYLADLKFKGKIKNLIKNNKSSGLIPSIKSQNPKYSYIKLEDEKNLNSPAVEVAEKKIISDNASAGLYYFSRGIDFVWAAEEMIKKNLRVNNYFYICPIYQQLIERGDEVKIISVEYEASFGSPEEIIKFKETFGKNDHLFP